MRYPKVALAVMLASASVQSGAITPEEAQNLTVAELAKKVLGEAGAGVIRVDRPTWPVCGGFCPPLTEQQEAEQRKPPPPPPPPPLRLGLIFYQRPFAVSPDRRWIGLCQTQLIHVSYDDTGTVTGLGASERYGVPDGMAPNVENGPVRDHVRERRAGDRACAETWTTMTNFAADSDVSAYRVAAAAAVFERASRDRNRDVKVTCFSIRGLCHDGDSNAAIASSFTPDRFSYVGEVSCTGDRLAMRSFGASACYRISLTEPGETVFVEVTDAYEDLKVKRLEYSHDQVVF